MPRNILVVEDETDIARLLEIHLQDLGCRVDLAWNGYQGLAKVQSNSYDLVILDLMLPDTDGLDICRSLRRQSHYTPLLMLTSRSSELDRVLGLELGADDYVTKPFSIRELQARVKAVMRRMDALQETAAASESRQLLELGDLVVDLDRRKVTSNRSEIELTAREFDLLVHFASHPGRVFTRAQLLDSVWGYAHAGGDHTVNSHINRLRAKIEQDPRHPRFILTVWGIGYKFCELPDVAKPVRS